MIPIIYVYTESYWDAKRLFNTLFRPSVDKEILVTEELWWNDGKCLEVKRDTEIWRIFKR